MNRARQSLAVAIPCLALALAGCGTSGADAGTDTAATGAAATASAAAENEGHPTERPLHVHIVLTGGKAPGTYDRTEPEGLCAVAGADMGGANLAFPYATDPAKPGDIQNVMFSAEKLSATATNNFAIVMDATGSDGVAQHVRIDPTKGAGTGSTVVTGTFPVYTAKVQGTSADGVKVDATLECAKSK